MPSFGAGEVWGNPVRRRPVKAPESEKVKGVRGEKTVGSSRENQELGRLAQEFIRRDELKEDEKALPNRGIAVRPTGFSSNEKGREEVNLVNFLWAKENALFKGTFLKKRGREHFHGQGGKQKLRGKPWWDDVCRRKEMSKVNMGRSYC